MTSDAGGPGGPVPGQPKPPEEPAPPPGEWPAELTPPPAPTTDDTPTAPVPPLQAPTAPGWGAQPAAPAPEPAPPAAAPGTGWGAQPAQPEPAPPAAAPGGWGQPADPAPAAPPVPTTAPGAQPGWGAAAAPAAGAWGAPPAGTPPPGQPVPPAPGQPGPYGVPPAGWVPAAGADVPPTGWNPQAPPPAASGNGCLKACLIIGIVLVVIGVIGIIGTMMFARTLFEGVGINPDGTLQECPYLPDSELDQAIGRDGYALPLTGLLGDIATGAVDERILQDADGCWIVAEDPSLIGRVAVVDALDADTRFDAIQAAGAGDYTGPAVDLGDEAFCTGVASGVGSGVLVRVGNRLVFVSMFDENLASDFQFTDDNVMYSPASCELAQRVAAAALN